jgi:tetratricopeptide (TPR) repeat protein
VSSVTRSRSCRWAISPAFKLGARSIVLLTVCSNARALAEDAATVDIADHRLLSATAPQHSALRASAYLAAGDEAYAAGRFDQALSAFESAYAREKNPRTLYKIGDTADKLGRKRRAVDAFQQYLALVPAAKDRAFIESRIRADQSALSRSATPTKSAATTPARTVAAPSAALRSTALAGSEQRAHTGQHNPAGPWWLWAGAGVLVVAGVVVAAVGLNSAGESTPERVRGNLGQATQTLLTSP